MRGNITHGWARENGIFSDKLIYYKKVRTEEKMEISGLMIEFKLEINCDNYGRDDF